MLLAPDTHGDPDSRAGQEALFIFIRLVGPGLLIGGTMGAAAGATIVQKTPRHRGSFWRALLGAAVGLLGGVLLSVLLFWLGTRMPSLWFAVVAHVAALPTASKGRYYVHPSSVVPHTPSAPDGHRTAPAPLCPSKGCGWYNPMESDSTEVKEFKMGRHG